jgi:outer membrane protein, heavy metal efflux system
VPFDRDICRFIITTLFVASLTGCASYQPLPLPDKPDLVAGITPDLVKGSPYPVDLGQGIDMTDAAIIAVLHNPDLKAERLKKKVAQAQAFAAGLLPDPQLSASLDHPTDSAAGLFDAYAAGLSLDLRALLTRNTAKAAAKDMAQSTRMDILWQEWQVIQKARSLYAQKYFSTEKLKVLNEITGLYASQEDRSKKALASGDTTLEQVGNDMTALMDAQSQTRQEERNLLQTNHDLDSLLGLSPAVAIIPEKLSDPPMPDDDTVHKALETITKRRPDLVALQAAYQSQEETLYKAVLEQFPSISIGFNRARDTSDVHTTGLSVTIDLPIFNRNRGEIAVQNATREQLRQEYQARLDQTHAEAQALWQQTKLLVTQINDLRIQIPQLEMMADKARRSYDKGNFSALSYIAVQNGLLAKKLEFLDLQQSLWTNRIAMDTLLAWPVLPQPLGKGQDL